MNASQNTHPIHWHNPYPDVTIVRNHPQRVPWKGLVGCNVRVMSSYADYNDPNAQSLEGICGVKEMALWDCSTCYLGKRTSRIPRLQRSKTAEPNHFRPRRRT